MAKYVATVTLSAQVTEDSYRIFQHHLECGPDTTMLHVFKWRDGFGKGATIISLTLSTLERSDEPR